MDRDKLRYKIHIMNNDDVIDLGNGYTVEKKFDKAYFKGGGVIFMELDMHSQQYYHYSNREDQFTNYIMQHIK